MNGMRSGRLMVRVDWTIHLIDTGGSTDTGGRIKRLQQHQGGGTFMLTWCDGLSNVDLASG
jgi:glucose-1-phosphate cytidylyltransferase